ncbi:Arc family DNA-binding protein [Streptomyces sp. NPDC001315]|uniref:Arc family DNA-binding protein n=1 Tax=Streptomyces sp. NPDC001315 TaxID=3364562 RepID=UPI00369D921E
MKHVNLRLPDELHELARAAAAADDRSLNSWLVAVVRRAVTPGETPRPPGTGAADPADAGTPKRVEPDV